MRFHLLGLAHLPTRRDIEPCAYTQKVVRLADMLRRFGHEVYFYGIESSEVNCSEFIQVSTLAKLEEVYGKYDWKKDFFKHNPQDDAHAEFNKNAIEEIKKRRKPRDVLLCPMGNYQRPIADACGVEQVVESGIGYEGIFCRYRIFESYAWMHYLYGRIVQKDGSYYDTVIPNAYHPWEFPLVEKKEDYFFYIGRLIDRKGIIIAMETARRTGIKLKIAGQGDPDHFIKDRDKSHVEYLGTVLGDEKRKLMGGAKALFVPTQYIGPFEGVAVEGQFCGTPTISTDWGCFAETVENGVSGYRCHTLKEFIQATRDIEKLDPVKIRERALRLYSTDVVGAMYHQYFHRLNDLYSDGWYAV